MTQFTLIQRQPSWVEQQLSHHWRFYAYKIAFLAASLVNWRLFVEVTFETSTGPWVAELSQITDFIVEEVKDQITGELKRTFLVVFNGKITKLPDDPKNEANFHKWRVTQPKHKK